MVKDLFAVSPSGSLRWRAPVQSLSVSAVTVTDGQVHISADYGPEKFVIAYDANDGSEVWRTEVEATSPMFYGPSTGPDGNLYGVIGGLNSGLGALSLAPIDGALRWNLQGFTDEGVRVKSFRVPFGTDRFFVSDRGVPCSPSGWGTVALDFDGDLLWCVPGLVQERPDVGPGDVLYGIGFTALTKFGPDGDVLWRFGFPPPVEPLEAPTVGPDGAVYVAESNGLWAFEPDGNVRFHIDDGLASAVGRVTVSGEGLVLHPFGGIAAGVAALDGQDGTELWRTSLPYAPDGPFAFSADGEVAYVARWGGFDAPSELVAIYIGSETAPVTVSAAPVGGPVVIGPFGRSFQYTVTLTNTTGEPQSFEAWTAVTGPVNREPVVGPLDVTLQPGATLTRTLRQQVPGNAPAGAYTYTVNVGTFGGTLLASDAFPFTKEGSALVASGGTEAWSASGWDEAASASSLPEGFALSAVYPNPARGDARLTLEVAEAQDVRAEVYDTLGRRVAVLHDGAVEAGMHALVLDGSTLPTGVYVVRVTGETFSANRRVTLVR